MRATDSHERFGFLLEILYVPYLKLVRGYQYLTDYVGSDTIFGTVKTLIAKVVAVSILAFIIFFGSWGTYILLIYPTYGWFDYVKYAVWWLVLLSPTLYISYLEWQPK